MDQFVGTRDRQDAQIWDAIEVKNYKQALKLVDKRLAKKPTAYHEALRIYVRAFMPQASEKAAVLLHLEELAEKKTVLSELVVLEMYDDALQEVIPDPQEHWARIIGELRWQYVKSSPKNEETSLKCFRACLENHDLDHARQIANSLEKSFPKNHDYIFWNISTMFLFSILPDCPEMQKKIWGGLALGQIGKLATATKQATDQKQLPLRSIQSPQELLLLHRITQAYGKLDQRLEYLRDPLLGPESAVAKGEWELWRIKLTLLEEAKEWRNIFDTTSSLLKRSRAKDKSDKYPEARLSDWIVWDAYIRSSFQLNDIESTSQVRAEVEAHLDPACGIDKSWKRNASLALVKVAFDSSALFSTPPQEDGSLSNRFTTSLKYLQEYGNANTAYNDLRPYVGKLNQKERKQFLEVLDKNTVFAEAGSLSIDDSQKLSTARQITESINTSKLRYLLRCSLPEHERSQNPEKREGEASFKCISCSKPCGISCKHCLGAIAKEALDSYRVAINDDGRITKDLLTTDRHPADDFAILAATCLIKLALASPDNSSGPLKKSKTSYLLQATALLENVWTHSKSNFQISLVLIRLYVYLGCCSLAMRAFQRLTLKQVQLDTLSYTLFDRISSLHPHPFTHAPDGMLPDSRTPLEQLQKHQKLYKSAKEHVAKNIWLSFKHSSYNSVFEIKEVEDTLTRSLARVMSVVESKKVSRLIEPKKPLADISQEFDILLPRVEESDTPFADTNDYETFPNYESTSSAPFEQLSRFVPNPSTTRYRLNLTTLKLIQIIDPSTTPSGEGALLLQWLKQHLSSQNQKESSSSIPENRSEILTGSEALAQATYDALALVICNACDKELWSEPDVRGKIDEYNRDLIESLVKHAVFVEGMEGLVPAFQETLHALYTAHEVGTAALNFCSYISRRGKDVLEKQSNTNEKVEEVAERLLKAVAAKCAAVKQGLDDGGWMDKVLESVLPDEGVGASGMSAEILKAMRELVDENFMEGWAGEVVESWKDSVVGFSLLKASSKT